MRRLQSLVLTCVGLLALALAGFPVTNGEAAQRPPVAGRNAGIVAAIR